MAKAVKSGASGEAPEGITPVVAMAARGGYMTAIAFDVLRAFPEAKLSVVDWFDTVKAEPVMKMLLQHGKTEAELLGEFVVALSNLQVLGIATSTKRARGMMTKMVFG